VKLQVAIRGFLMDWELRGHSPNTLRLYRSNLQTLAHWLAEQGVTGVEEVTIAHLRAFMLHTQQRPADASHPHKHPAADGRPVSTATLQSYVKSIKVLFHWLVDEEVLTRNPALRLQKPVGPKRVKVTFKPEHLTALISRIRRDDGYLAYRRACCRQTTYDARAGVPREAAMWPFPFPSTISVGAGEPPLGRVSCMQSSHMLEVRVLKFGRVLEAVARSTVHAQVT